MRRKQWVRRSKVEIISWRGTPGVGDFMWALNCAHNHAYETGTKVELEFHWEHDESHNHHFEDPETIIERCDYLHSFYNRQDDVTIKHVYEAYSRYRDWKFGDDIVEEADGSKRIAAIQRKNKARFWFQNGRYDDKEGSDIPCNDWGFRQDAFRNIDKRKVVIWRPTFNAETPRTWKKELTNDEWDVIIRQLSAAGLYVVELTYRTPVREALYHISTCRQIVCYDGMWHYIARNLYRPMLIISREGITKYHTPHALTTTYDKGRNIWSWLDDMKDLLGKSKHKARHFEKKDEKYYDNAR